MVSVYTDDGKDVVLNRAYKSSPDYTVPTYFIASASSTTPTEADSTLNRVLPTSNTSLDAMDAITGWTQSGDGDAVVLNTTAGEFKEGTGCLNIPSTYSTGTSAWSKSFSSTDLSDNYIAIWFYVDSTANLQNLSDTFDLILGTGGFTNANHYKVAKTSITTGWNYFSFNVNDYSSQDGSGATLSGVDNIKIQVKTSGSYSSNSMRVDFLHYFTESDILISFTSGYPTFDEVNNNVTIRGSINSTQMNDGTPDINKIYVVNNDGTKKVITIHSLSNAVSKTSKTRLTLTETTDID